VLVDQIIVIDARLLLDTGKTEAAYRAAFLETCCFLDRKFLQRNNTDCSPSDRLFDAIVRQKSGCNFDDSDRLSFLVAAQMFVRGAEPDYAASEITRQLEDCLRTSDSEAEANEKFLSIHGKTTDLLESVFIDGLWHNHAFMSCAREFLLDVCAAGRAKAQTTRQKRATYFFTVNDSGGPIWKPIGMLCKPQNVHWHELPFEGSGWNVSPRDLLTRLCHYFNTNGLPSLSIITADYSFAHGMAANNLAQQTLLIGDTKEAYPRNMMRFPTLELAASVLNVDDKYSKPIMFHSETPERNVSVRPGIRTPSGYQYALN
jgi:hypothetical protein